MPNHVKFHQLQEIRKTVKTFIFNDSYIFRNSYWWLYVEKGEMKPTSNENDVSFRRIKKGDVCNRLTHLFQMFYFHTLWKFQKTAKVSW